MIRQLSFFEEERLTQQDAIALTIEALRDRIDRYDRVGIAYSGGKDSTALVCCIISLIEQGKIPRPKKLSVIFADTRQELPPLYKAAHSMLREVEKRGFNAETAIADIDNRFLVYMLGRGVPPPSNTFRWCTPRIKVEPMMKAIAKLRKEGERVLMLTGVRLGESAVRDRRILMSCTRDGGECGQGWLQTETFPGVDTLAPLIHWRVCHVWDYLIEMDLQYGWPTYLVAETYGGDERYENNARMGCVGCPLVQRDTALERLILKPEWTYLAPLLELKGIYSDMRSFKYRLQKDGTETKKDGTLVSNPGRKGPLTLEARLFFLDRILKIQHEVNVGAEHCGGESVEIISTEEEARIRELVAAKTWPQGWSGDEPAGDILLPHVYQDGSKQLLLF